MPSLMDSMAYYMNALFIVRVLFCIILHKACLLWNLNKKVTIVVSFLKVSLYLVLPIEQ